MDSVEWKTDDAGERRGVVGEGDSSGQVNGITLGSNRDSSWPGKKEKAKQPSTKAGMQMSAWSSWRSSSDSAILFSLGACRGLVVEEEDKGGSSGAWGAWPWVGRRYDMIWPAFWKLPMACGFWRETKMETKQQTVRRLQQWPRMKMRCLWAFVIDHSGSNGSGSNRSDSEYILNTGEYGRVSQVQGILLLCTQRNTTKPRDVITTLKTKSSHISGAFYWQ